MAVEDRLLTDITEARTTEQALGIVRQVRPKVLAKIADLLYIDPDDYGVKKLREAIVREARA
jgi:hypothetical protein